MSKTARIMLIGAPHTELAKAIANIKEWDNGNDYPIAVTIGGGEIMDSIANVEEAVHGDLETYITKKFDLKGKQLKTGSLSEFLVVPEYDESGKPVKAPRYSRSGNNTPKKKKRVKRKRTHRK